MHTLHFIISEAEKILNRSSQSEQFVYQAMSGIRKPETVRFLGDNKICL